MLRISGLKGLGLPVLRIPPGTPSSLICEFGVGHLEVPG